MWHYVVVTERRDHRYGPLIHLSMLVLILSKDLRKLGDHEFILLYNLLGCSRDRVVVIVPRRIACPYDKVNVILDIVVDPFERLVDQRIR